MNCIEKSKVDDCMRYFSVFEWCVCSEFNNGTVTLVTLSLSAARDSRRSTTRCIYPSLANGTLTPRGSPATSSCSPAASSPSCSQSPSARSPTLDRSSRRYHDEHGELVPVERLEQERDVEGGAEPVHRIRHIQYDQRDEQHQQHVARVALHLTVLPHASPFGATLPARTTKRPSNSPHLPAWPRARRTGGRIASARERSPQRQRARTDPNSLLVREDA